jgi:hypothetical protein
MRTFSALWRRNSVNGNRESQPWITETMLRTVIPVARPFRKTPLERIIPSSGICPNNVAELFPPPKICRSPTTVRLGPHKPPILRTRTRLLFGMNIRMGDEGLCGVLSSGSFKNEEDQLGSLSRNVTNLKG